MRQILGQRWLWLGLATLLSTAGCNDKPPEYNQTSGEDGERKEATRVYLDDEWDDDCDASDGDNEDWRYISIRRPGVLRLQAEFSSPNGLNANVFIHDKEGRALNGIRTNGVEDTYDLAAMPVMMGRYYLHVVCKAGSSSYTLSMTFEPEPTDERPPVMVHQHPPMKRVPVQERAQRRARDRRSESRADLMRSSGVAGKLPDQVTPKDTRYVDGQQRMQGPRSPGVAYNDIEVLVLDERAGRFVPLHESRGLHASEPRSGGGLRSEVSESVGGAFPNSGASSIPTGIPGRPAPEVGSQPPSTLPKSKAMPPQPGINERSDHAQNPLGVGTIIMIKPNRRGGPLQVTIRNVGTALNPEGKGVLFGEGGSGRKGSLLGLPHRSVTLFQCEAQRCYGTTDATISELQTHWKVDFR